MRRLKLNLILGILFCSLAYAEGNDFLIVVDKQSVPVVFDSKDAPVVDVAAKALADDISLITDVKAKLLDSISGNLGNAIIIGTLGKSEFIDKLAAQGKIKKNLISNKWETFLIQVVDKPFAGIDRGLVIAGSDPRGTAFGVFELSKRLGVSPWVYWADVKPAKQKKLSISIDEIVMGPPSVKFRGIFLNDEDWGLKPWAARNIDTDIKDIGPKTYARIFELMLRLKANYIWPAMHPCTKAFFYYDGNQDMAAKYQITIGSSHCEPMLRNNIDEWKKNFTKEYGKKPGPWRYDINKDEVHTYWEDRVRLIADKKINGVFTIGMRGIHDGAMPGPKDTEGKIKLLNEVMADQRSMFVKHFGKAATEVPQIFCPYKEVLKLYLGGAEIPDDVTLVWADDNHGYIRKLSNPEEQKRSGGSGVYYHISYWGAPADYLWLCSTSPALISYEMSKAYDFGADRLWGFNVGDIKPAEMETEFAMDLAWDVKAWTPEKSMQYIKLWAERTFGEKFAEDIAKIKTDYYRLAADGKPEHIDRISFSKEQMDKRITVYGDILLRAEEIYKKLPSRLQDAFFQLVLYPVAGAAKMNEKHFCARRGDANGARKAYDGIKRLTDIYNKKISDGKWNGIMSMAPRLRNVFKMPEIKTEAPKKEPVKPYKKPILLDMAEFETTSPMVHQKGMIFGTSTTKRNKSNGGLAKISFHSDSEEARDLYFNVRTPSDNEDSWFISVNNRNIIFNDQITGNSWQWVKIGTFKLKKGENYLTVSQREPNAIIKEIQFGKPGINLGKPIKTISVSELRFDSKSLQIIPGLGPEKASISRITFNSQSYKESEAEKAPSASIKVSLPKGLRTVKLICIPTHAMHEGRNLQTAVRLNDSSLKFIDVHTPSKTKTWYKNVIRGYSSGEAVFDLKETGDVNLQFFLLDPGLAISKIVIY